MSNSLKLGGYRVECPIGAINFLTLTVLTVVARAPPTVWPKSTFYVRAYVGIALHHIELTLLVLEMEALSGDTVLCCFDGLSGRRKVAMQAAFNSSPSWTDGQLERSCSHAFALRYGWKGPAASG